jgi:pimeloyl-ACP methyl ester carboxylesterase
MEAISDKYRTYAMDLWGFGDSDKSQPRYEVSDYVALLNNFMDNMGLREAPIVGHALGATVALEYAAHHPDRAKKVMAISLPMTPDSISRKLIDFAKLAVYGEKDDMIDPGPTRVLDSNWQNIRPIGLADSKHFPMLDEAAKFTRLLQDFLEIEGDLSSLELKEEWRRRTR